MGKRLLIGFILGAFMALGFFSCSFAANQGSTSKAAIKRKIVCEAKRQGLCPILALSVAKQESAFNKSAVSHCGAVGLFQLMPQTAKDLCVNPWSVDQNIKGGIKYLKAMKRQFGSTKLALAAYNAGPGAVSKYKGIPPYKETQDYVKNIMRYYNEYKKRPDPALLD